MSYRIGVYGSATTAAPEVIPMARRLGRELAHRSCTLITGACSGLPYQAAYAAAEHGAEVWGFSPAHDIEGQRAFTPEDDLGIYSQLHFIPSSFPYADDLLVRKKLRNVISTATCDAGIVIGGRWGTLHEVTSLVDFGKVIGVITSSGEVAAALPDLVATLAEIGDDRICFAASPEEVVARVIDLLDRRRA